MTTFVMPTINIEQIAEAAEGSTTKWQPKKLTEKHKNIIALHTQSMKRQEIAEYCGCTPEYVSMVVATDLAQAYMRDLEKYLDHRVKALYDKSVDVIHDGLNGIATDTQLKAARLQLEMTGKLKEGTTETQTAEDVVAALLKAASAGGIINIAQNIQVNN